MIDIRGELPKGALVKPLRRVVNERGDLLEVQREDDPEHPGFGQAYLTTTFPGVIRAWYRHAHQIDQLVPVSGRVQVVLHEEGAGTTAEFVIGDLLPALVLIPAGVWHGFRPVGGNPATLLHINHLAFDFAGPDEERLAQHDERIPFRWT